MDSYPAELVKCVSPLVFVANAILSDIATPSPIVHGVEGGDGDTNTGDDTTSVTTTAKAGHTQAISPEDEHYFQSFLKCITTNNSNSSSSSTYDDTYPQQCAPGQVQCKPFDPLSAILSLDPLQVGTNTNPTPTQISTNPTSNDKDKSNESFFTYARMIPVSHRHALPPSKDPKGKNNTISRINTALGRALPLSLSTTIGNLQPTSLMQNGSYSASSSSSHPNNTYHYTANGMNSTLTSSLSSTSTNTSTTAGLTTSSSGATHGNDTNTAKQIHSILSQDPIEGILPSGWLEKHVHALPSTILIVTKLDLSLSVYQQAQLEQHLAETMEGIRTSCAKKRDVPLHLVCLVIDPKVPSKNVHKGSASGMVSSTIVSSLEQERLGSIKAICRVPVTALHVQQLPNEMEMTTSSSSSQPASSISPTTTTATYLQEERDKLEKVVSESSNTYYMNQVRRCKKKHSSLHHEKVVELLPIAARYCFKIAMFYDLQMNSAKAGKSMKYWKEAYENVMDYYRYLQLGKKFSSMTRTSKNDTLLNSPGDSQGLDDVQLKHRDKLRSSRALVEDADDEDDDDDDENSSAEGDVEPTNANMDEYTSDTKDDAPPSMSTPPTPSTDDGVEVSLVYSPKSGSHKSTVSQDSAVDNHRTHSEDMIHQCRGVADWLNFKILTMLYVNAINARGSDMVSSKDDKPTELSVDKKFAMISKQIRRHRQVFISTLANTQREVDESVKGDRSSDPSWYYWKYVAHQRLVFAQLTERYPILSSAISQSQHEYYPPNNELRECHTIVHYVGAGESLLRLASCMKSDRPSCSNEDSSDSPTLTQGLKRVSSGETLEKRQRFVGGLGGGDLSSMYKEECKKDHSELALKYFSKALGILIEEQRKSKAMYDISISPARIHYLISGIWMVKQNYEKAMTELKKALESSKLFPTLVCRIEKALIYALKRCSGNHSEKIGKLSLFLVMNRMINSCFELNEFDQMLRDATSLTSKSTLDHDKVVEWSSAEDDLLPFLFSLTFPEQRHAIEGDAVPVKLSLQSKLKTAIRISSVKVQTNTGTVEVHLKSACNNNVNDINCSGSSVLLQPEEQFIFTGILYLPSNISKEENQGSKATPSGKSKTSGLTAEGGSMYGLTSNSAPNLPFGGICVYCLSIVMDFEFVAYPGNPISMKVPNTHCGSLTKAYLSQNRPIVEEDDYVSSAWDRPTSFPLSMGPRCLRMLPPRPDLRVTNLTLSETNGYALEGTVNRILLEFKAGSTEICRDVQMSVVCDSVVHQPESQANAGNASRELLQRIPVLVQRSVPLGEELSTEKTESPIPSGWKLCGGQMSQGSNEVKTLVVDSLQHGDTVHSSFDLFRQLPSNVYANAESSGGADVICKTNYVVTITYRQIRSTHSNQDTSHGDLVTKHHSGSVLWSKPILASTAIALGPNRMHPSGNRHPSNQTTTKTFSPEAILDGETVMLKSSFQGTDATNNGMSVQVDCVSFDTCEVNSNCSVEMVTDKPSDIERGVMFSPRANDICHILRKGTRLKVSSAIRPKITNADQNFITSSLGHVLVKWRAIPLSSPFDIKTNITDDYKCNHGPLSIDNAQPVRCYSPVCHIESAPFGASTSIDPPLPTVLKPFQMKYVVTNKTNLLQHLKIIMRDVDNDISTSGILVSGLLNGEITLEPEESKILAYSVLATRVGQVALPVLSVSSSRYESWVIRTTDETFFVAP